MTNKTEGIRKQASELIEQAYQRGYNAGKNEAYKNPVPTQDAYMQGLNDAWEAARKIASYDIPLDIFELDNGKGGFSSPLNSYETMKASEVIERINAYEERKKQEENEEIKVGDVIRNDDVEAVVTWCDGKDWNGFLLKGECVGEVGQVYSCMSCNEWKKTGRHFPEIVEVLKKLQ